MENHWSVTGGQSFLASIQNLLIFAIFKLSLNLNLTRHWSENWCPGYLKHALFSSEIYFAVAKSLEIIGHVTNCCKRPIGQEKSFDYLLTIYMQKLEPILL